VYFFFFFFFVSSFFFFGVVASDQLPMLHTVMGEALMAGFDPDNNARTVSIK